MASENDGKWMWWKTKFGIGTHTQSIKVANELHGMRINECNIKFDCRLPIECEKQYIPTAEWMNCTQTTITLWALWITLWMWVFRHHIHHRHNFFLSFCLLILSFFFLFLSTLHYILDYEQQRCHLKMDDYVV